MLRSIIMTKLPTRKISVSTGGGAYSVCVGVGLEKELIEVIKKAGTRRIAIISDSTVGRLWGPRVVKALRAVDKRAELFVFPAGERNKNQSSVTQLQHALLKRRFGRDSLIVALGGGVVGDLAGFVAATYLRGIPYIQMPTTVLSMVDSSVGGKVGIDTAYGKNTIGAFWQPKAVIADLNFLEGLPRVQVISGFLEAIKTFFTSDKGALSLVKKLDVDSPLADPVTLQAIIHRSISIKTRIVERDEREKNERKVVNFGHTIGHAVELLSGFKMPHGYAVGYGILVESKISELLGILSKSDFESVQSYLLSFGIQGGALKRFPIEKILDATKADKKSKGGVPHYVLLSSIGRVYRKAGQYASPVESAVIQKALTICSSEV